MTDPIENPARDTAVALARAGFSVLRVREDGSKTPAGRWKHRTEVPAPEAWASAAFAHGERGVGVVCGAVSGNLELFELEAAAMDERLDLAILYDLDEAGRLDLWERLEDGWVEDSPSGGRHWLYRIEGEVAGNTKLATRPHPQRPGEVMTLIETRGEGGFTVVAPSNGRTHPTGGAWRPAYPGSDHTKIVTITAEERDLLHQVARGFHDPGPQPPAPVSEPARPAPTPRPAGEAARLSPADDYNQRATWEQILCPRGWAVDHVEPGGVVHWRRPGKSEGASATTGRNDGDNLYVFSSSTPFQTEKPYSKFAALALLEHAGDLSACATRLLRDGYGDPLPAPSPAPAGPAKPWTPAFTHAANADLLVEAHGDRLRYDPARKLWLRWDGRRWAEHPDDAPCFQAAERIARELGDATKEERDHKRKSLSFSSLSAVVRIAERRPALRVRLDDLDSHPLELNTPDGIVDLATGRLGAHDPARLHTKLTGAGYDPSSQTPVFSRFLATVFAGDTELIAYVQRLAGLAATGRPSDLLPFLHGAGANGKSVFMDVLLRVLGDYATAAPPDFLLAGRSDRHEEEIARLRGMRLVACSEVRPDSRFDEARVKHLTGGDKITASFKYGHLFTFSPAHSIWLMGNHQPKVEAGGTSFWRRLRLVPFTVTIPEREREDGLAKRIADQEGPGVLAWIVAGAALALKEGLAEPARVADATRRYAREEDHLGRFLEDCCRIGGAPMVKTDTGLVRASYSRWCREQGESELSGQGFGREIARLGIEQTRSNGRRFYLGLSLIGEERDDDERRGRRYE